MITRAAVLLGVGGALVLGPAGVSRAATAAPVAVPASDGLGGLLSGLLGEGDSAGDSAGDQHSHVTVRCDDGATADGTQLLAVHGLSVVAVLQGVHVLGLNLGNCEDHSDQGLLGGLLGGNGSGGGLLAG